MPTHDEKPAWELRGEPPPHQGRFDREAERLRAERARAWREKQARRDDRRSTTSIPPPPKR